MTFEECDSCRAKPGAPTLCHGCLSNRARIAELEAQVAELTRERDIADRCVADLAEVSRHNVMVRNRARAWAARWKKIAKRLWWRTGWLERACDNAIAGAEDSEARLTAVKQVIDALPKCYCGAVAMCAQVDESESDGGDTSFSVAWRCGLHASLFCPPLTYADAVREYEKAVKP